MVNYILLQDMVSEGEVISFVNKFISTIIERKLL